MTPPVGPHNLRKMPERGEPNVGGRICGNFVAVLYKNDPAILRPRFTQ